MVEQTKNNIRSYLKRTLKTYYILGKTVITEKKKSFTEVFFLHLFLVNIYHLFTKNARESIK